MNLFYIYCRGDRLSSIYLYICCAGGPIRGHLVVRGQVNVIMEVGISEYRKGIGHADPRKKSEEDCFLN